MIPRARWIIVAAAVLALGASAVGSGAEQPFTRYRVEQVFRLETTTAKAQLVSGRLHAEPSRSFGTTAVEGRVRLVLEQRLEENAAGRGTWRFTQVGVEGPHAEPSGRTNAGVGQALARGLAWMQQLDGQEFSGAVSELPVLPLGETPPPWLTSWLRWAQTGSFSGVEQSPVTFPVASRESAGEAGNPESTSATYQVQWLRSEFRQELCQVQQARWAVPVVAAPASVSAELAAAGVEARTYFAGQSLEWVSQERPALIYAERSAVRETFWNLEKVKKPELQELVFRLRFAVQVRVERLP